MTAITAPGYSRDAEEVTTLESDNQYKEWIAGMKEHSDVTLSLNWVPNASDVMVTAFEADTGNYKITAPNAVTFTFGGFVTSYEFGEMTPGGKMTATATFKIDGKATVA